MRISVLTLFPEYFENFLNTSVIGRAVSLKYAEVDFVQIRDFAKDRYKHVDDHPYGGGAGQLMRMQPLMDALDSVRTENSHVVLFAPTGSLFTQKNAHTLAEKEHLILICGHYEGFDARIYNHVDEVVSIGDYVLSGGEPAAVVVMDAVIRLLKGTIKEASLEDESHENGLLEYPQYTKPYDYNGETVPDVLLSGDHAKVDEWRQLQSLLITRKNRPDLFAKYTLTKTDEKMLSKWDEEHGEDE